MDFGYKRMYMGGKLLDAAEKTRQDVICPGLDEKIAEVAWAGPEDADLALESARSGFELWKNLSHAERFDWMLKLRDALLPKEELLRESIMYEMGKPYPETAEDFQIVDALAFYPEAMKHRYDTIIPDHEDTHRHQVISQPAGVVVAYLPWNFPLLCFGFKLAPALAAGCSIIIKPSPYAPLSSYLIGETCHEIGFPEGVINVLCGPVEVAQRLSSSTIPRVVTMIGSTEVAKKVIAQSATSIKKYNLELGGNAPVIVFPDADVRKAAEDVAALKFGNCGQICVSPNRVFVHSDVVEEFTEVLMEKAKEVRIGFGREKEPTMGPLINRKAYERIAAAVEKTVQDGADLVYDGALPPETGKGIFFSPKILRNVTSDMEIFRKEIFGPVISVLEFTDEEEVIRQANSTEHGLASYLYTHHAGRIQRISEALEFGEVMVNGFKWFIHLPHLGIKNSGVGADCSWLALEPYLIRKRITFTLGK